MLTEKDGMNRTMFDTYDFFAKQTERKSAERIRQNSLVGLYVRQICRTYFSREYFHNFICALNSEKVTETENATHGS